MASVTGETRTSNASAADVCDREFLQESVSDWLVLIQAGSLWLVVVMVCVLAVRALVG